MGDADRPRVFLIDDEVPIGRVVMQSLEHRWKFDLVWDLECPECKGRGCNNCRDEQGRRTGRVPYGRYPELALELLCREGEMFDVIFLDIIMPKITGITLFHELERVAPARCERTVFITGGGLIPAVREFIEGRHHIEKPFSLVELETTTRVYADTPGSRGPR